MISLVGAAALPAAAFALPSISGGDGVAINPPLQSPDFIDLLGGSPASSGR